MSTILYPCLHVDAYRERERERESERETVLELAGEKGRDGGGVGLLMYEALGYWCIRPCATGVCGLKLLVCKALSY
jgi:hypothetical protein